MKYQCSKQGDLKINDIMYLKYISYDVIQTISESNVWKEEVVSLKWTRRIADTIINEEISMTEPRRAFMQWLACRKPLWLCEKLDLMKN